MDLLYGSEQKYSDMDEEINDFLDNDVFQSPPSMVSGGSYPDNDDEWFNSFFEDPVLNDKMITDAAQPPHIKSEHSYSSMNEQRLASSSSDMGDIAKLEDLESDFLINNNALDLTVKTSGTSLITTAKPDTHDTDPLKLTTTATPTVMTRTFTVTKQQPTIIVASSQGQSTLSDRSVLPKITVKTEVKSEPLDSYDTLDQSDKNSTSEPRVIQLFDQLSDLVNIDSLVLPPTPPSSNNSDSDSCPSPIRSAPSSPVRHMPYSRHVSSGSLSPSSSSSKHYSHSLYSSSQSESMDIVFQQIPTSGVLVLTEEEKRTLISEGYPIPSKLPLTKQEEKNLKKIRRKIKNKISAQESRRKKKEYLEALEKRVESFSHENNELKKKVDSLETNNRSLMSQLHKLQNIVGKLRPSGSVPQTGLMVLVFCFAVFLGSWTPYSALNVGYSTGSSKSGLPTSTLYTNPQLVKPAPLMGPHIGGAKVVEDAYCTPPMKSRVLMSLRGEQDDLTWEDLYGPNTPAALQHNDHADDTKIPANTQTSEHHVTEKSPAHVDASPTTEVNTGQIDASLGVVAEKSAVKNVEVMEVTVDGRFGHANHSRDEDSVKTIIGQDIARADIKAEGLVESADRI